MVFDFPCAVAAELTAVALDGTDVLEQAVQTSAREYVLAAYRLELGWHSVVYSAQDDAGNTAEGAGFVFDVLERKPYRVNLYPGWNLISFPFFSRDPSIENVIGSGKKASVVMAYRRGEWTIAVRGKNGWQGELTAILPGYGYWVWTTVTENLEIVPVAYSATAHYSTTPVERGWNLLGVQDTRQVPIGAVGSTSSADDCFSGAPWRVAYGFSTRLNEWDAPLLPNVQPSATVENGRGYWLWSEAPGSIWCRW